MTSIATFDWLSDLSPLFNAQDAWFDGSYQQATFVHLPSPSVGPFSIACGGGMLAEHIRRFRFSPAFIQRLGQVTDNMGRSVFHESFLNHLQRLRLRINVSAAPEGTLLLPGEPLLIIQGPRMQTLLLESAFRVLVWDATHWASQSALSSWGQGKYHEEDTPHPPATGFHPEGWKTRAVYIGGGDSAGNTEPQPWPGLIQIKPAAGQPLSQIRRLFKADHPLGDVWLSPEQEEHASVSRTHISLHDLKKDAVVEIQMTRYQNLYQPVLLKGHPILAGSSVDYLRQRTWKQLEAFGNTDLATYPLGWHASEKA